MVLQSGILLGQQPAAAPARIVSLVPSITELLDHLGLDEVVKGITKFCTQPEHWRNEKTLIGGTKKIDVEKLLSLSPDLVIANKEENVKEQIDAIANHDIPVYVCDVQDIAGAYGMISDIGLLTHKVQPSIALNNNIKTGFMAMPSLAARSFAYFIWQQPWMVAGGDTFISNLLSQMGWRNIFEKRVRYPEISLNDPGLEQADYILLSSEPFPFAEKHIMNFPQPLRDKVVLVDGAMLSWYGSRLLQTPGYMQQLARQLT